MTAINIELASTISTQLPHLFLRPRIRYISIRLFLSDMSCSRLLLGRLPITVVFCPARETIY